ncbi:molybdopterin-binding protein [Corynebacterium sp. MSK218]|uniref:molybdopterin-binding protein n=1 Tax=Corynebacterium sp. MSK218 TaxID=3050218 RepID=UPI00254B1457|nr:molybdopterin-binding protein [Corynebacterium sp. MSK218]MDK8763868.1 molybdopterin-binding protein [Corynebacterium sp. MSK218]
MTPWTTSIIVASDRVLCGEKANNAGVRAQELAEEFGCAVVSTTVVAESFEAIDEALRAALESGARVVIVIGATGTHVGNVTPEVTERYVRVRLHGVETQVLMEGLKNSPKAGLCRGIIGLDRHGGNLIINSASSRGAVEDTLGVVLPLLPDILGSCGSGGTKPSQ